MGSTFDFLPRFHPYHGILHLLEYGLQPITSIFRNYIGMFQTIGLKFIFMITKLGTEI